MTDHHRIEDRRNALLIGFTFEAKDREGIINIIAFDHLFPFPDIPLSTSSACKSYIQADLPLGIPLPLKMDDEVRINRAIMG